MTNDSTFGKPVRNASAGLIAGNILLPIVFAWFFLRPGYSARSRIIAFSWLILLESWFAYSGLSNDIVELFRPQTDPEV